MLCEFPFLLLDRKAASLDLQGREASELWRFQTLGESLARRRFVTAGTSSWTSVEFNCCEEVARAGSKMEYLRKGAQAASKLGNKILEVTTIAILITSSRTGDDATACWARACVRGS